MYSSTFIFAKKQFDKEFFELDKQIADMAKSIPGYIGEESWVNLDTGIISGVYYWETMEALQTLIQDPRHQEAKAKFSQWLDSYKVIIAEVHVEYGDKTLGLVHQGNR